MLRGAGPRRAHRPLPTYFMLSTASQGERVSTRASPRREPLEEAPKAARPTHRRPTRCCRRHRRRHRAPHAARGWRLRSRTRCCTVLHGAAQGRARWPRQQVLDGDGELSDGRCAGATRTSALATHRAAAVWPCHRHSRVHATATCPCHVSMPPLLTRPVASCCACSSERMRALNLIRNA